MMTNGIIIDNFLDNVDEIREEALLLDYTKSLPESEGWKGFRCLNGNMLTLDLHEKIKEKLVETNIKFDNCDMRCFFHYTLEEHNVGKKNTHRDYGFDYAGVLYLAPNPQKNSGTSFYNDLGEETGYLENVYNRLVIYPANELHSLKESFGNDINNGRLTFTFFCKLKNNNI
jgi:hypothetical protein